MRVRTVLGGALACAATWCGVLGGVAQADVTFGSTSLPAGATNNAPCNSNGAVFVQSTAPAGTSYAAPFDGALHRWSVVSAGATPGVPITLIVVRRTAGTSYTVVGTDTETIPSPLPGGGVATFTPATPMAVQAGDQLGIYQTTATQVLCGSTDASRLPGYTLVGGNAASVPTAGSTVDLPSTSPDGFKLLVSADLQVDADAALGPVSFTPASVYANSSAVLQTTAGQVGGSAAVPLRFTLPAAGLPVLAAVAGDGACTVSGGQAVSCDIGPVGPGSSVPVAVVVGAPGAGTFRFTPSASVVAPIVDGNPANDTGSGTLVIAPPIQLTTTQVLTLPAAPVVARCTVPDLKRVPAATAGRLLKLLHCRTGRTTKAYSSVVAKGLVIKASRKVGSYASATTVGLQVSKGRRPAKRKAKH